MDIIIEEEIVEVVVSGPYLENHKKICAIAADIARNKPISGSMGSLHGPRCVVGWMLDDSMFSIDGCQVVTTNDLVTLFKSGRAFDQMFSAQVSHEMFDRKDIEFVEVIQWMNDELFSENRIDVLIEALELFQSATDSTITIERR